LFILDDLRADHVSAYGYGRNTTPLLDARAAGATRFTSCLSPAGWTLPGCASIITGQPPEEHGLVDHNHRFQKPKLGHYLGDAFQRVAFANNGNTIPDTVSLEYLESLGLKRRPAKWKFFGWQDGFDEYHWTHREDHIRPFQLAADFFLERARGQERREALKPYLLFFHTNIVHDYHLDRDYYYEVEDWLGHPLHPELRRFPDGPQIWREPPAGLDRDRMREEIVARYDAGVRFADRCLAKLLDLVDFRDTLVVVMSDHGEGFEPELGRVHHCGRLHQDLLHVPLFLWLPPALQERYPLPRVEERPCSTIDVVPTLLTLLGGAPDGLPGRLLFDLSTHRSVAGLDRGYVYWLEDCVRESYDTCRIDIRSELTYPLKSIRVRRNDTVKEFAFNLAYDPGERDNLLDRRLRPTPNPEPITFIVAVNDPRELDENLLASPAARSDRHQWILVDNRDNRKYRSVARLYAEALAGARHDLVFFVHQDLHLPWGWEEKLFESLADLESFDRRWGVIGAVGALPADLQALDVPKELRGHW
ncbi:MAG: sulfatase-like hydrolase/transferase, partial [Thermoanaerobaculia bacterium]